MPRSHRMRTMQQAPQITRLMEVPNFLRCHIDGIMGFTDEARVVHVDYYRLLDNPVAEMARVHSGLGIETSENIRTAITDWHAANPKNARGRNDYTLADYGLEEVAVRDAYSDYIARFSIPTEADGLKPL